MGYPMPPQLAPQKIISFSAISLFAVVLFSTYLATLTPWMGIELNNLPHTNGLQVLHIAPGSPAQGLLSPGDHIEKLGGVVLNTIDRMEEPDAFSRYHDYNLFFDKQTQLYEALTQPTVHLQLQGGKTVELSLQSHRPLSQLPLLYWYQIACGAIVFMAGMSVLAFRPRETVTIFYALTGFGLLLASVSAAIYSTRELAMQGELFYQLSLSNQFGTLLFAGPFISILWYYPRRIHAFPLGPIIIVAYMVCWWLNLHQVFESLDVAMRYPIFVGLIINLTLAMIQWRLSRTQPVQRAILKWFLLAWLSGTTLYVGLHTIPLMLGLEVVLSQSVGWGVLVSVYLGIALGITRYRLFNLDRWVVTGWYWFLGGIAIIGLDALLISFLKLNSHLALATTLAVAGWAYFPLRQMLWQRFSWYNRGTIDYREMLPSLLTTVLKTQPSELPREWNALLERTFSPLNIEAITPSPNQVEIHPEGSALMLPGFHNIQGLKLSYADRGGRLFNQEDQRLAEAVHKLFSRVQHFREAFNDGVHEERRRVARDLHDDVGAKLLTLVYSADTEEQASLARETLQELRDVIRNLEQSDYLLGATLDELHRETARRCESHKVKLLWTQPERLKNYPLASRQHSNLQRMVREIVTNALRHSAADILQIEIDQGDKALSLAISNNNVDFNKTEKHKAGRGMRNIRSRAEELDGLAEWRLGEESVLNGYTVKITMPMWGLKVDA